MRLCVTSAEFHFSKEIEKEIQFFQIKIAAPNGVLSKVARVSGNTAGRQIGLVSYYHNVCWQLNPLDILALWARWVFHVFLSVLVNKLCINPKVSKFQKQIVLYSFEPKTKQNISALRIDL